MPTRPVALLACCLLWVPSSGLESQELRAGQTVRVRLADGRRFEARLAGVDSSPLVPRFQQLQQVVPITAIDSLWLRRRATGRGAIVGGIVVGGASFAFLTIVCQAISEGQCDAWGAVIGLSVAGAGAGALVGAGIGSLIPRWQRLDPQRVTISFGVGNLGVKAGARIRF